MNGLVDFLLARIAEDEAVARAAARRNGASWATEELPTSTRITGSTAIGNPRAYPGDDQLWDDEGALGMFPETAAHIVRWNPVRVLAECEAKRRIVETCRTFWADPRWGTLGVESVNWMLILTDLAFPYLDHPDYRDEWRL